MTPLRTAQLVVLSTTILGSVAAGSAQAQSSDAKKSTPSQSAATRPAPDSNSPKAEVAGSFGNWTLLCGKDGEDKGAKKRCSLILPLVEKATQKLVFRIILTYGPKGNLILRVDGPTGIALQRGVEFSPDTQKIYRMPFQTCLPLGCKALILVKDDMRKELADSSQGSVTVYALNGKPVRTLTTLEGFSAGMQALDKRMTGK